MSCFLGRKHRKIWSWRPSVSRIEGWEPLISHYSWQDGLLSDHIRSQRLKIDCRTTICFPWQRRSLTVYSCLERVRGLFVWCKCFARRPTQPLFRFPWGFCCNFCQIRLKLWGRRSSLGLRWEYYSQIGKLPFCRWFGRNFHSRSSWLRPYKERPSITLKTMFFSFNVWRND